MSQTPMISIPRKQTDEVDWTTPIRTLILKSYGESPDSYSSECSTLQRCRQDAVRGAGSDSTARDLLYKYFGQLELLELRFSEIRVGFPWRDAFTGKLTTQTSMAFEKASILFQIASVHSSLAQNQSRADPEGVKRAFYYFKTCAGMLTYINDNFLHAPSTDLSREVVKFLIALILAQATEVFFEKCVEEKKGGGLVAKVASQAAGMYAALGEQVKEFMGKGIFDRNWVTLIQIKSKYYLSLANYHRPTPDHGERIVRLTFALSLAKDSSRLASTAFTASLVTPTLSPTLPPDASPSLSEKLKSHTSHLTDLLATAQKENDLIYHAILPSTDSLPVIETLTVAQPIPIQEVYGTPEVQKTIGQDIFIRLVPMGVHESASVYSEEKAKLVRAEVERVERADSEAQAALASMGVKEGVARYRVMLQDPDDDLDDDRERGGDVPREIHRMKSDISLIESQESTPALLSQLSTKRDTVRRDLDSIQRDLELESRECESMRVRYGHRWGQDPSASFTVEFRKELKTHLGSDEGGGTSGGSLAAAAASDRQVLELWEAVRGDIGLLLTSDDGQLEQMFSTNSNISTGGPQQSLLDLDEGNTEADALAEAKEKEIIAGMLSEVEGYLMGLKQIGREREGILRDLKDKILSDDVSHLLLLNNKRTNPNSGGSGVEPALFAAELEKFRPYQHRLEATVAYQEKTLGELKGVWRRLQQSSLSGSTQPHGGSKGKGGFKFVKKWEERDKRKRELVKRFERAKEAYVEVRDGIAKGLTFYTSLSTLTSTLQNNVKTYLKQRTEEREGMMRRLDVEMRLGSAGGGGQTPTQAQAGYSSSSNPGFAPPPPPLAAKPPNTGLGALGGALASMHISGNGGRSTPPAPHGQWTPPTQPQSQRQPSSSYASSPAPNSYGNTSSSTPQHQYQHQHQPSSSYSSTPAPGLGYPPPPNNPSRPISSTPSSYLPPPPPPVQQAPIDPYASLGSLGMFGSSTPPSQQQPQHAQYSGSYSPAPPPPPPQQQQQQYSYSPAPPPQQHQQQPGGYNGYSGLPPPPPSSAPSPYGMGGYGSPPQQQQHQLPSQQYQHQQQGGLYGGGPGYPSSPPPPATQQQPQQQGGWFPPPPPQGQSYGYR